MPVNNLIQLRKGSSSTWSSQNPVLSSGEPGYDLTNNILKVGDGVTPWNNLTGIYPDLNTSLSSGSGIIFSYADSTLTISTSGFLTNIVEDLTPQLGGNLDLNSYSINGTGNISISGNIIANTGSYNALTVNSINVSLSGHTHTASDITNFNEAVDDRVGSGLLVAGTGVGLDYNDNANTLTINVTNSPRLVTTVFNNTGSTIPKFRAVYINGGQGDQPTITLAANTGDATSAGTYGVTSQDIDDMSTGEIVVFGALTGINTDQFNPSAPMGNVNGIPLYLGSASGNITSTKPYAPNHIVTIGTVVRTHQNEGVVEVRIINGFELEELHDVAVTGVTNGQFLQYNSSNDLWIPSSSGNFTTLQLNGTTVSVSGHTHTSSDITNFNSSVSGLLPTIANSGDNRILTSTGSTVGINAESNLTFNGSTLGVVGGGSFSSQTVFASGTAAAPGISILGDTDTGLCQISSVGTNSLSISTSGVERVRFTSDGTTQVRANSSNISTLFTYNENGGELVHYDDAQAAATLLDQCNNQTRLLELINGSDLLLGLGGSNTTGSIRFMRAGFNEAMRIDSAGRVGIGLGGATPATAGSSALQVRGDLDIFGNNSDRSITYNVGVGDDGITGWYRGKIAFIPSSATNKISTHIAFFNKDGDNGGSTLTERMRITADGNVGIGTSSPSYKLQVDGAGDPLFTLNATNNQTTAMWFQKGGVNKWFIYSATSNDSLNFGNPSVNPSVVFTAAGSVGIGTTSPSVRLHISRDTADIFRLQNTAANGGTWDFKVGGGGFQNKNLIITRRTDGADSADLIINNTGNVGIASEPVADYKLFVNGGLRSDSSTVYPAMITVKSLTNTATGASLVPTIYAYTTTNGTYGITNIEGNIYHKIDSGRTNSGSAIAFTNNNLRNFALTNDAGTISALYGIYNQFGHYNTSAVSPTTNDVFGFNSLFWRATGTITNAYDIYCQDILSGATVTNRWGIYITHTGKNYFAGNVGIGAASTSAPEVLSVMQDNNGGRTSILIDNLDQRLKMSCYYQAGVGQYSEIQSTNNAETGYTALVLNRLGGSVGVGVVPNHRFDVRGSGTTSATVSFHVANSTPTSLFYTRDDGAINTGTAAVSPYNNVTGTAANVVVGSDGFLYRSTSSLRYKTQINDATHGLNEVLKLRSVTFKSQNDGNKIFGGLIAEEVDSAGLTEFVQYDSENRPDAIHYSNMVALLVKAIQEQQTQINELKNRLSALEGE